VASSYLRFERHVLEEKARKNFIRDFIQYEASEIYRTRIMAVDINNLFFARTRQNLLLQGVKIEGGTEK
jgi:hypothetical protein